MQNRPKRSQKGDPYAYLGRVSPRAARPLAADEAPDPTKPRGGGLDYAHYLIPRQNDARPSVAQVAALVRALLEAGYIPAPGSDAQQRLNYDAGVWSRPAKATGAARFLNRIDFKAMPVPPDAALATELSGRDFRLSWPIQTVWTAGLKYALDSMPTARRGTEGPGYTLEIHSLADYVYISSDWISPFPNLDPAKRPVLCKVSGTDLHYTADRIDNMFDQMGARVRHTCPTCSTVFKPQERRVSVRDGWSGSRRDVAGGGTYRFAILLDCGPSIPERSPRATPEFKALCEEAIGQPLYEIGTAY